MYFVSHFMHNKFVSWNVLPNNKQSSEFPLHDKLKSTVSVRRHWSFTIYLLDTKKDFFPIGEAGLLQAFLAKQDV